MFLKVIMHCLFYWQRKFARDERFDAERECKSHHHQKKETHIKEAASLELNGTGLLSSEPELMGLSHRSIVHGENIAPVSYTKSH